MPKKEWAGTVNARAVSTPVEMPENGASKVMQVRTMSALASLNRCDVIIEVARFYAGADMGRIAMPTREYNQQAQGASMWDSYNSV
jgi:hypothetical protein